MRWPAIYFLLLLCGCGSGPETRWDQRPHTTLPDSVVAQADSTRAPDTLAYNHPEAKQINTGKARPEALVAFAKTLYGKPYLYASTDPAKGFDCSGFVFYVFSHFGIEVPRSSTDFTRLGKEVAREEARPGDLILFTGTDSSDRTVGHMGIVTAGIRDSLRFIHSSSGSANGVTITPLNSYYQGRFMKVIRVFP